MSLYSETNYVGGNTWMPEALGLEASLTPEIPNVEIPAELLDMMIEKSSSIYFLSRPTQERTDYRVRLRQELLSANDGQIDQLTLAVAGLWANGLGTKPTPNGREMIQRNSVEIHESLTPLDPEYATQRLRRQGAQVLNRTDSGEHFGAWLEGMMEVLPDRELTK